MRLMSIFFMTAMLTGCSPKNSFEKLELATGGGFSGELVTYKVKQDGRVYKHSSIQKTEEEVYKFSAKELRELIGLVELLAEFYPEGDSSGNMNRSLSFKSSSLSFHCGWTPQLPPSSAPDLVFHYFFRTILKP